MNQIDRRFAILLVLQDRRVGRLPEAANAALSKVCAVLPAPMRDELTQLAGRHSASSWTSRVWPN